MKKLSLAAILLAVSCAPAPVTAGYDKDLCEWSMTANQEDVEQLKSGGIMQYNYVLYCDPNFDNKDIVTEITGE